jgi:multidrug transporter EmrE-like cation transporter
MGYLFLLLTIITESVAVIFMKLSNGFQYKVQAAIAVVSYILSFIFLILCVETYASRTGKCSVGGSLALCW